MSADSVTNDNYVVYNGVQVAPFRTLNDFALDARFGKPQFADWKRWNNRVVTNLLYFQTNYFVTFLFAFLLISSFNSHAIWMGFSAVSFVLAAAFFMLSPIESVKQLRASHPYIMVGVLALIMYFVITQLSAIMSLVFALAFPLLIVFAHASFRLRDTSAKVNYHLENVKLRNTAMFTLLNGLGLHERT